MNSKGEIVGQDSGNVIICATSRLVRAQYELWIQAMRERDCQAWETPAVYTWHTWLDKQSARFTADGDGALLSRDQAFALWERVIRDHDRGYSELTLLHVPQAVRAAWDSWVLSREWEIDEDAMLQTGDRDTRTFVDWCHAYRAQISANGWLDPVTVGAQLNPGTPGFTRLPSRMTWIGFDRLSPGQSGMIERLRAAGVAVTIEGAAREGDGGKVAHEAINGLEFGTVDAELTAALRHARRKIEENSRHRIAIIVPQLNLQLAQVEYLAKSIFYPGVSPLSFEQDTRTYHISLGRPLSEHPMLHTALLTLNLLGSEIEVERAVSWILSSWVHGAGDEMPQRAMCAHRLRRKNFRRVSVDYLKEFVSSQDGSRPEALVQHLENMVTAYGALPRRASPRKWARLFDEWLTVSGWPGDEELAAHEFQLLKAWQHELDRLASLNAVHGELELNTALGMLIRQASGKLFRARSEEVPVEIMGMLEPAGQKFDEIWLTGMSDAAWPPTPAPDPFVPVGLQREVGVPNSTPELALASAQRTTAAILASADDVTVSFARTDGDEQFGPSPVFGGLVFDPQHTDETHIYPLTPGLTLETLANDHAPQLADDVLARGGSQLVTYQSQCPFRAFAVHRLGAGVLVAEEPGLDSMERGLLVHDMLENFWSGVAGRDALVSMDSAQLDSRVSEAVEVTIDEAGKRLHGFKRDLLALERRRLEMLLREWLTVDASREAGFTIHALELEIRTEFAGRSLTLRIDRIDRLESGDLLIIDYKTGNVSPGKWAKARPPEPQLPFYLLALSVDPGVAVVGLTFARARAGDCKYAGIADQDGYAAGIIAPTPRRHNGMERWQDLVNHWATFFHTLANEFSTGAARVDPSDGACDYCDLAALCRINEIRSSEYPETAR